MRLKIIEGMRAGAEFEVGEAPITIGRLPRCEVELPDRTISREHARIFQRQGVFYLADLHSANGTFLEGTRVTRTEITPGATIRLGAVVLRFEDDPRPGTRPVPLELAEPRPVPPGLSEPVSPPRPSATPSAAKPEPARPVARERRSFATQDLDQHGRPVRLLAYLIALAVAAALFYGAYLLARGG
ncbi:MAG: FHA domain-containing protein [Planctomycetota bacterium]